MTRGRDSWHAASPEYFAIVLMSSISRTGKLHESSAMATTTTTKEEIITICKYIPTATQHVGQVDVWADGGVRSHTHPPAQLATFTAARRPRQNLR